MRFLIVGGTSFVGRAIAWSALNQGHDVTVINRGQTHSDLPGDVKRLTGDREHDLSALKSTDFDVTVDAIAYRPRGVKVLHDAIGDRGGHHIQISSVSAYESPPQEGATEATAQLHATAPEDPETPVNGETYGPLKAACERAAQEHFSERLTVVRPTYVIGSHDATLRFPYWTQRLALGGDIAIPGPRGNAFQFIDARDLGDFVITLAEHSTLGDFHVANPYPALRFADFIELVSQQVSPKETRLVEVPYEQIMRHRLESRFPLWSGAKSEPTLAVDPAKSVAAGLNFRSLSDSVNDVSTWWDGREGPSWWLTREQEAMLIRTGDQRGPKRGPGF
ncbi:MAG: NAD-dependent epimerase/dehydratase family protein [Acidimicrobiaceae bacterium]|nr:NAD-dependent epimerase/dehydratase family protein [Acidimicrobiaceae bacterium]